jgi:hypothetical protein
MKLTLSDRDRCILLIALARLPEPPDSLLERLSHDQPWAPLPSLTAWSDRHLAAS